MTLELGETKICQRCWEDVAVEAFDGHPRTRDGLTIYCRPCLNESKQASHTRVRLEKYLTRLDAQGGRCAICELEWKPGMRMFDRDHDHSCCPEHRAEDLCGDCNRALLCQSCNMALGLFKDRPELLRKAAYYIESWR